MLDKTSEEKQLMLFHDISIWLDNYDDIFSDFDPRSYSERALSDDFIAEVRKVCREREEAVDELKLLIPDNKRNGDNESVITKRLHTYFKKNYQQYEEQYKGLWKKGILFAFIGMLMMLIASYISALRSENFLTNALFVIFEPSGWFILWSGLDIVFYTSKPKKKELDFYNKLSKTKIAFFSI